ncbi:MAG TPA: HAD family phosphatase [Candidatus Ventrousia excrementavium]|uniref:HAD family phosphatase n=1 Tax=Candidatus Ventrousia excrementavium TaxID=2840961 RepID=A0A9D1IVF8_9CLOT|nr:HAD family phosphatase [Candidatus Ventrousia excrementavium]
MSKFDGYLILSDMDGTLLGDDRQISQENREAVAYFTQNGGRFAVATGRSKAGMEYFLQDIAINAPCVICNGAVVYDFQKKEIVRAEAVGQDGYELALDLAQRFPDAGIEVSVLDGEYVARGSEITRRHFEYVKIPYRPMAPEEIAQPWIKLNLTMDPDKIGEMTAYIDRAYAGRFHAQHSAAYFYEILKPGATKGAGARFVCQYLGIDPDHLFVVGDGQNDVELLQSTRNCYAPENAHPDVLRLHPALLPGNNEHTIAALIKKLDADITR